MKAVRLSSQPTASSKAGPRTSTTTGPSSPPPLNGCCTTWKPWSSREKAIGERNHRKLSPPPTTARRPPKRCRRGRLPPEKPCIFKPPHLQHLHAAANRYNIGVNCGESAGQAIFHLHYHLIAPRDGDTENPRGGVRGVMPGKRSYGWWEEKSSRGRLNMPAAIDLRAHPGTFGATNGLVPYSCVT